MTLVEFSKDGLCDACQNGKQKRASFSKKLESAIDEPLQLLHMDLFGPVNALSISRKRYCLVIVDDFSKFSWTYFLGSKDEASEIIINHIKQVNNHLDFKVRNIRSDNGTEFRNSTMRLFCEENGIMHEFSAPRTPQQNGVVERKNISLIEAARTMLEESKLLIYFWAEAVNCACYTQNISLINQAKCMTPYQLFKRRKPTLNFLHVFGCKCYILRNQPDHKGKFDAKADEGIFVGYSAGKSYRVYNLRTNIVMESVHVVFDDKKIDGLTDEGHHEALKFDNIEIYCDDSEDENDGEDTSSISIFLTLIFWLHPAVKESAKLLQISRPKEPDTVVATDSRLQGTIFLNEKLSEQQVHEDLKPEQNLSNMSASFFELDEGDETVSLSDLSSSFKKCFQSAQKERKATQVRKSQEPVQQFKPFDYEAARKQAGFGDNRRRNIKEDGENRTKHTENMKNNLIKAHTEGGEESGGFQLGRRRQAFPPTATRSATFH
ncbi:hypothetical protein AgCh_012997 [Apium graveolens]